MVSPISSSSPFTQNAAARTAGVQQLTKDLQKLQQTGTPDGSVKQDIQNLRSLGMDMMQISGAARAAGLRLPPPPKASSGSASSDSSSSGSSSSSDDATSSDTTSTDTASASSTATTASTPQTAMQKLLDDLKRLKATGKADGSVKQDVQALQAMGLDMRQIQGGVRKSGMRLPPAPGQGIPLNGSDALSAAS